MGNLPDNVRVIVDEQAGQMRLVAEKTVVKDVTDPKYECSVEEAKKLNRKAKVGDTVAFEINTKQFGRISAQTAKQVIIQGIREAERGVVLAEFESKRHEIITGKISKIDPKSGAVTLEIGRTETILDVGEQVRGESYREGQFIKVYVVEVRENPRGPQVVLSRTHPGLVRRLFELEVPEIRDGTVEVKAISREAGSRTKIAVWSNDENVDPVGSCVGAKGARVNSIVEELRGEKIDIIKYSEDPSEFVAAAISPASVISVAVLEDGKSCRVIVPDDQLSLAIGKEGQNARLAAKLTGLKIDIKPLSQITGG
jgi:N utilization substance protein A